MSGLHSTLHDMFAISENMTARNGTPRADTRAPARVFLPNMGMPLWYGQLRDRKSRRDDVGIPAGLFRHIACGP